MKLSVIQVLDYCNASPKDYKCIFTSGATAALKLVGEAFPWSCNSNFMYTMENHNSVIGIREYPPQEMRYNISFVQYITADDTMPLNLVKLEESRNRVQRYHRNYFYTYIIEIS